jgi:signal transduction histidine kinase/ligand-binding sensor domain-containing protein
MPLLIALILALAAPPLHAATGPAELSLRDYIHTMWTQHDGVPIGRVRKILQTSDGYLWLITRDEGLLRFDGMRFVAPSTPCKALVTKASSAPDGSLWAICGRQLIRRTPDGLFIEVPQTFIPTPLPAPTWLLVDPRGRPWFFFDNTVRYLEPDGTGGREVPRPTSDRIRTAAFDADGTLWVSDTRKVVHVSPDRNEDVALSPVWCLVPARDHGVFALTADAAWRLRKDATPSAIEALTDIGLIGADSCLSEATDGGLWVGTDQQGLALLRDGRLEMRSDLGLIGRSIETVFIDREGTIWAGATTGLQRFRKPVVHLLAAASRRLSSTPTFLFVDSRENIWVGPGEKHGVDHSRANGTWASVAEQGHDYWAIGEDESGRIWLSNTQDIGYVANEQFVKVRDAANARVRQVSSFMQDEHGQLWAMAIGIGVYRVTPGPTRLMIESSAASSRFLVSNRFGTWLARAKGGAEQHLNGRSTVFPFTDWARAFVETSDSLWIVTSGGLRRWRNGQWTFWTHEHGLPKDGLGTAMIEDRFGRFWIMSSAGLLMVARSQLDATPDGSPRQLTYARMSTMDGVVPPVASSATSPLVGADRDGRLYFATYDSALMVDPSAVLESSFAPPLVIESVTIDNQPIDLRASKPFVEPSRVRFDFTSLNLRNPEHARFRYRLDGYDRDWIDAGVQRHVTYGTLRPGSYRFRVIGAGGEGVWNEEGAAFAFQIAPVFWRTLWFRATILGCGILLVTGLYRLRVRQLTRQFNVALDARVAERTRIARELHDTLLQTFHGVLIHFQAATNLLPARPDDARRKLESVLEQGGRAITEARDAVQALRLPASGSDDLAKDIGILGDELVREHGEGSSIAIGVNVEGTPRPLRPMLRDDVYRIASEALRNAVRHAQAQTIQVDIHYDVRYLQVRIRDDGTGIDGKILQDRGTSGHWGLPGMRERAELIGGTLEVRSRLGSGTEVDLSIPAAKGYDASPGGRRFWSRTTHTEAGS